MCTNKCFLIANFVVRVYWDTGIEQMLAVFDCNDWNAYLVTAKWSWTQIDTNPYPQIDTSVGLVHVPEHFCGRSRQSGHVR